MLKIHNSLTSEKEVFTTLRPNAVSMYVCGITVYDYLHVGHARMLTVFDLAQRYLRARGYDVTYVRNITDVDDKIIQRAAERGEPWRELAERFITAMHEDCAQLGLMIPDHEPRATDYIGPIIAMTQTLIDKGYAYVAANHDVMYSVRKFAAYGRLSGKKLDEQRAGARVQVDTAKLDPLDFVLWKHAKPGEPSWPSPWGNGRPGWHIECSAMSVTLLGDTFDLHGGGMDLKFPHHENEIAQSCAACDSQFARTWMHNGFVRVDDEKMSKSLGNFFTVREVLSTLRHPEVLRFFLLSSHYSGPINYSKAQLAQADETLLGLYRALQGVQSAGMAAAAAAAAGAGAGAEGAAAGGGAAVAGAAAGAGAAAAGAGAAVGTGAGLDALRDDPVPDAFYAAMDDDFNTPVALAVLQGVVRELNTAQAAGDGRTATAKAAAVRAMGGMLGILQQDAKAYLQGSPKDSRLTDAAIEELLGARRLARDAKNFVESDRIRNELSAAGVLVDDKPGGIMEWRRA